MDEYSFIMYMVNPYLNIKEIIIMKRISKFINKQTIDVRDKITQEIKEDLKELYNIIISDKAERLNIIPNEINYNLKIKLNHKIYKSFILNECDKYEGEIYKNIKDSYVNHYIKGEKTCSRMDKSSSFITTIIMYLYH